HVVLGRVGAEREVEDLDAVVVAEGDGPLDGGQDVGDVTGAVCTGDLDRDELGLGGDTLVRPVGGGAVAGDDPGHERAVAEVVGVRVGVVRAGEVDSADHPAGEVGHRGDAGVDEGHGDAVAV